MDYQTVYTQESLTPSGRTGHSGLGTSSFIIALLASVILTGMFVIAGVMEMNSPDGIDEESASTMLLGFALISAFFAELLAIGLGIAGLIQRKKGRLFAILGLCISSFFVLITAGLMIIGLTAA
tara:strand:+ start:104 stop:475 length:372 start_codon:yes stop_codon:yes gene_type:complete